MDKTHLFLEQLQQVVEQVQDMIEGLEQQVGLAVVLLLDKVPLIKVVELVVIF
jgi:hypothetical protein